MYDDKILLKLKDFPFRLLFAPLSDTNSNLFTKIRKTLLELQFITQHYTKKAACNIVPYVA